MSDLVQELSETLNRMDIEDYIKDSNKILREKYGYRIPFIFGNIREFTVPMEQYFINKGIFFTLEDLRYCLCDGRDKNELIKYFNRHTTCH